MCEPEKKNAQRLGGIVCYLVGFDFVCSSFVRTKSDHGHAALPSLTGKKINLIINGDARLDESSLRGMDVGYAQLLQLRACRVAATVIKKKKKTKANVCSFMTP